MVITSFESIIHRYKVEDSEGYRVTSYARSRLKIIVFLIRGFTFGNTNTKYANTPYLIFASAEGLTIHTGTSIIKSSVRGRSSNEVKRAYNRERREKISDELAVYKVVKVSKSGCNFPCYCNYN